jgi:hypothetical protein
MHAGTEPDILGGEAKEETRMVPAFLLAVPEEEVEVVLVEPFIAGKAGVAVHPADRAVDLGRELDGGRELAELRADRLDEGAAGADIALVVEGAMGVEPLLGVVLGDPRKEGSRRRRKPTETCHERPPPVRRIRWTKIAGLS